MDGGEYSSIIVCMGPIQNPKPCLSAGRSEIRPFGRPQGRNWLLVGLTFLAAANAIAAQALPAEDDPRLTPVVKAYRLAGPAVVNVSSTKTVTARWGFFGDDLFDEIFPGRRVPVRSLGSGIVISPVGYVVTNAHVVSRAQEIHVTFADKTKYEARIVVADIKSDLAIIKIILPKNKTGTFPYLPLGRSDDLMIGETVIAVGNPLGLANTVTVGIISATDRTLSFRGGVEYVGLIQTDAPINHGNSGGPLLNVKGELIGINTAIRADAQNIGFAIPVGTLREKLADLLDFERLNRVLFGASVRGRSVKAGGKVYVTAVRKNSPAYNKLRVGDRILAVGDVPVRQITDYVFAMLAMLEEQTVHFRCLRDGEKIDVAVGIRARPKPDGKSLAEGLLGVKLREITPELAGDLQLPAREGLLVVGVEQDAPAHELGVHLKDILFHVAGYTVKDFESLGRILEDYSGGEVVSIGILRGRTAAIVQARLRPYAGPQGRNLPGRDTVK